MTEITEMTEMQPKTKLFRQMALWSYLGLFAWMLCWYLLLGGGQGYSMSFIVLWFIPLLLPMRGMVAGSPYTHAWANFIIMIYFMHGLTDIYANSEQWYFAAVEIVLCSTMLTGCCFYARMRGRELGLGLKKLKDME